MTIEAKIDALIAAIEANTKALGGAGGGKASGSTKAAATKKATTLDQVAKRYGAFMSAEGDEGKAFVRKVVGHFDVKKISEIDPSQFDEALALLDKKEAGDDPFGDADSGEDLM